MQLLPRAYLDVKESEGQYQSDMTEGEKIPGTTWEGIRMPRGRNFGDLERPWQNCLDLSWDSYKAGSVPVGAVVLRRPTGRCIASGRNRINEREAPPGQIAGTTLAHAEINALVQVRRGSIDPRECVIYSVLEPCPLCMGAIYMSGIRTVAYACRDGFAGSTDLLGATPYMSRKGITVIGPSDCSLEAVTMALQVDNLLSVEHPQVDALLDTWRSSVPLGVELGLVVHRDGFLRGLAAEDAPAETVVDQLLELLSCLGTP